MEDLEKLFERLSDQHTTALKWFFEKAGTNQPWPQPLPNGTLLVARRKGIYKPAWTDYALSVRMALDSSYTDMPKVIRPDGTWSFSYYQEGSDPADRDSFYTNLALLACQRDKVPVGVIRQVTRNPNSYYIDGLALIVGWEEGYFFLEGFSANGYSHGRGPKAEIEMLAYAASSSADIFDPDNVLDGRKTIISSIVVRQGQSEFRQGLIDIYRGRCAISGCQVVQVLEAAHIIPYRGPQTNHLSNGLLLRADLHTLFDLGLIAVDTNTMTVIISPQLENSPYNEFQGAQLCFPEEAVNRPSKAALNEHRKWAGL